MLTDIHTHKAVSITDFKRNPQRIVDEAGDAAVALLNRNRATAYIVPASTFARLMEELEDAELGCIIEARRVERDQAVEVKLDDL
jgi:antitoxin StbD